MFPAAAFAAPVRLSTITVAPGSVTGGTSATGTATLTGAAPHNGAVVTLSSSNTGVATVPASITIPQGATSGTFTVTTSAVATSTSVTITGNYGVTATGSFSVVPPTLSAFSVNPTTAMAVLGSSTGTVTLNGPAPAGGQVVTLSSNNAAATLPSSVTVAAGATSANVAIATHGVYSSTDVTLTATLAGNTRLATLTVTPCVAPGASAPSSFPATDVNWIDDSLPAGMTATGLTWDTAQKASGAQSATAGNAAGFHEVLFTGATSTLTIHPSEDMVTYVLVSACIAPREIVLGWHTAGGSWVKAYYGQSLIGGEGSMVSLGAVPAGGQWLRVAVPASQLGIVGASVDGFDVQAYDGQLWVDRVGKSCVQPLATPGVTSSDTLWIDDVLPGGATLTAGAWDTNQHASGTKSISTGAIAPGLHSIAVEDATTTQPVYVGEKLVFYVLLDMCSPPTEMLVRWKNTWGETRGMYWGTSHNIGLEDTNFPRIGAMPSSGSWIRMEVPAAQFYFEDRYVTSFYVDTWDGRAWFDGIGKGGVGCATAVAAAPSIPPGDTVWIDDGPPAGANVLGHFDPVQHASGASSFHIQYNGPTTDQTGSITGATATLPLAFNENLVAYVLINSCAAPTELALKWHTTSGQTRGVYWGTPHGWGEGTTLTSLGAMPAADVWQRIEVPAAQLALAQRTIDGIYMETFGGEVWLDHVGKNGTPCYVATAAPPSIPSGDVLWIEDALPAGATSNATFDTAQKASGSQSMTLTSYNSGDHQLQVSNASTRLSVGAGDTLVAYVLLNECAPPTELLLTWRTTTGSTAGAYWGTPHGLGEGTSYFSMGSLPAVGTWTRLEVSARQLGIEGQLVNSMTFENYDGQAWWDHVGKVACAMPRAAAPSIPPGDTLWVDDGMNVGGGLSGCTFDSSQAASGTYSFTDSWAMGTHTLGVTGINTPITFGETVAFYALLDTCSAPTEVRLQVNSDRGEVGIAYWGTPHNEPVGAINMGPLGPAGTWQRLEVSAAALKIESRNVTQVQILYVDGHAFFDHLGKGGTACPAPTPSAVTFPSSDVVWVDDSAPDLNSFQWDTAQFASGYRSISTYFRYGNARQSFNLGQMNQPVYVGDSLVFYALLDACAPPTQVSISGWDNTGTYFQAFWGAPLGDEPAGAISMGALPAAGQWQRLEVPFSTFRIEEHIVGPLAVSYVGGHAWLDRIGRNGLGCVPPHAAAPTIPSTDVVWVDDDNPPSGSYWTWDTSQAASGTKSFTLPYQYEGRHDFNIGVNGSQPVYVGDSLVFYALIDPCAPPTQISVAGWDNTGRLSMSYWGTANGDEAAGAINMGPLPAAGVWQRFEVPLSLWRIEEHLLGTLTLSNVNGHVWYDHIGRNGAGCVPARAAAPAIPSTDVVWVDDDNPPSGSYWTWDTSQAASGTKSFTLPYQYEGRHDFNIGVNGSQPVYVGDSLVFYALIDSCAPPTQISVGGWDNTGRFSMSYWGTANGDEAPGAINMGPLPAAGVWVRFEVPMSSWRIEGHLLGTLTLSNVNGHVWYDHIGRNGAGCVPPQAAAPTMPSTDVVWFDDGTTGDWMLDTSQAASGTTSFTRPYQYEGRHEFNFGQIAQPIAAGEKLVFYVLVDPCAPPTQINIAGWSSGRLVSAYWGTANGDEADGAINVGSVPAAGSWQRLEVPAATLGIEGAQLDTLVLSNVGGHAWYDHIGKSQ
ncbi:MAG TPA: hypothetical protein VJZ76_07595 [Thermoanaerobaculia bacterium]|nr:hypothetical protein [Thermoanaerobaculia bacterium]